MFYTGNYNYKIAVIPEFVRENICSLKNERKKRGLSQKQLAIIADIKSSQISHYENMGIFPEQKNYNKLAAVLNWKLWKTEKEENNHA